MPVEPLIPDAEAEVEAVEHLRAAGEYLADADARLRRAAGIREVDPLRYARTQATVAAAHASMAAALTVTELRDHLPQQRPTRLDTTVLEVDLDSDPRWTPSPPLRFAHRRLTAPAAPDSVRYAVRLAREFPGARIALVAATADIATTALVAGPGGALSLMRHADRAAWNPDSRELRLPNGSTFKVYGADRPLRLRGPQHHFAIAYDRARWQGAAAEEAWTNLRVGVRLAGMDPAHIAELPEPAAAQAPAPALDEPEPIRNLAPGDTVWIQSDNGEGVVTRISTDGQFAMVRRHGSTFATRTVELTRLEWAPDAPADGEAAGGTNFPLAG